MSHGTGAQKNKKNRSRPKASQAGLVPSIQKKSYNKGNEKTDNKPVEEKTMDSLF
jgi:hypothetical protein